MSVITLKNEITEDLLACRACLATNRKLYALHQYELSQAYKNLTGIEVSPYDVLPQYVCNCCSTLLVKYQRFRDHCQQARRYLEDAETRNKIITIDYLNGFQPFLHYNKAETKTISITENEDNATIDNLRNDIKIDETHLNYVEVDLPLKYSLADLQNDIKNHTEIVKIEMVDDIDDTELDSSNESEKKTSHITNKNKKINIKKRTKIKNEKINKKTKKIKSEKIKHNDNIKRKGKYFETKENMSDFEKACDVDVIVLNKEQQLKEFLDRKSSDNYLLSPYKCDLCYKGFMGLETLNKHVQSQHDPSRGNVVCEFCRFRYKDRRGLTQHTKSHRLKFACKQCPYVSRTTFNAKEHFKMHGGQMHECRHCGKSHEKLSSHLSHLRIRHPSEFIWCDVCGEAFIGPFGRNVHKKIAHRHLSLPAHCTCDKSFIDTAALKRHLSFNNCAGDACVHCGETFSKAMELRDHLLEKHRSTKVYACEKCDKTFPLESRYNAHYLRMHVESAVKVRKRKETPWICEICGKTLPNKCVLRYHQRNHTGEKPFQCSECPKSFTMRKLLQSHQRVHTSDRPFTCKFCPKTFKGPSALRGHEYTHTGGQAKVSSRKRNIQ